MPKKEEEMIAATLGTIVKPNNLELLYALYKVFESNREKVTPERLVELTGLYSPPDSLEKVNEGLSDLSRMAYVSSDEGTYGLTDSGIIVARALPKFFEDSSETIKMRLRRIDDIFKKGV